MKRFFLIFLLPMYLVLPLKAQKSVDEYIQKGLELHDAGDYEKAIKTYQKALEIDAKASVAMYEIAFSYFAKGNYKQAIRYADKVIKAKQGYLKEAFLVKGSALDNLGEVGKAIDIYKQGVDQFPYDYLLYYNLGIANYNQRNFIQSEQALTKALELNPDHTSSHLMLAYLQINQGKKIQALLPLYTFLLLEADTERSNDAYALLKEVLLSGTETNGKDALTILAPASDVDKDEFSSIDLYLSMLQASSQMDKDQTKTEIQRFVEYTQKLIVMLKESKKEQHSFWWTFYVELLARLEESGNLETYCYYISHQNGDEEVIQWLENNKDQLETFANWLSN